MANSLFTPFLWSNVGPDPEGYTRVLTSWPAIFLGGATGSTSLAERIFFVYTYVVAYALAVVASSFFLKWVGRELPTSRREVIRFVFVALCFFNPAALDWQAGVYYPLLWGAPLLIITLLGLLIAVNASDWRYSVWGGLALGLGATLLPEIYAWGVVLAAAAIVLNAIVRRELRPGLIHFARMLGTSMPGAALTFYSYYWPGLATGPPIRTATYQSLSVLSANSTPLAVFQLLGQYWSTVTYAPPSLLSNHATVGMLPTFGSPPYMILPEGLMTAIWLLALGCLPILAFSAMIFRRWRARALPIVGVALLALASALGTQTPGQPIASVELAFGQLPYVGNIVQTAVGVPINVLDAAEAAYIVLITLSVIGLLEVVSRIDVLFRPFRPGSERWIAIKYDPAGRSPRPGVGKRQILIVLLVLFVLVLGSWQTLSGSYFPAGQTPGVNPNLIPPVGALAPEQLPMLDSQVYDKLSADNGSFNVYWPGSAPYSRDPFYPGVAGYAYPWSDRSTPSISLNSPKPYEDPIGLPSLVRQNLTGSVAPLLSMYGIKYLIIDNMSGVALALDFGAASLREVVSFFETCPNLQLTETDNSSVWLFMNNLDSSNLRLADLALSFNGQVASIGPDYQALSELGFSSVYVSGDSLIPPHDVTAFPTDYFSPSNITFVNATALAAFQAKPKIIGFNGQPNTSVSLRIPGGITESLPAPFANWTVSTWSGPAAGPVVASVTAGQSVVLTSSNTSAFASVNYLTALVPGDRNAVPIAPNGITFVTGHVSFQSLGASKASVSLQFVSADSNAAVNSLASSNWTNATPGQAAVSFQEYLPSGSAEFTLRVNGRFSGSLLLHDIEISFIEIQRAPLTFSGSSLESTNASITLPPINGQGNWTVALDVAGSGQITPAATNRTWSFTSPLSMYHWILVRGIGSSTGGLTLTGSFSIAGFVVLPLSLTPERGALLFSLRPGADYSLSFSTSLSRTTIAVLVEQFSSRWQLRSGSLTTQPVEGGLIPETLFLLNSSFTSGTIGLNGVSSLPYILTIVPVFSALMLILTSRHLSSRIISKLRRILRSNGSTERTV